MLAEYMANPNGLSPNIQAGSCKGRMNLPPKGPSQAPYCGPIHTEKQVNMPKSCSTDVLSEDPPPWLEDLLNEPDSPANKPHHRRAASDSFAYSAGADSKMNDLQLVNNLTGPAYNFQMPWNFNGGAWPPQASCNRRNPSSEGKQQQDRLQKSPSNSAALPNVLINAKEDAGCQALGMSCSSEPEKVRLAGNETENKSAAVAAAGTTASSTSASNNDAKRKQHNARRSRVRKLQYIAELERNAQVLQVAGAEASAQLEFLDQQNLILGMENKALKQRLDSLSQEHYIKSMEQEILDKELARLQYLYHLQQNVNHHQQQKQQRQRQKQNPAAHRRGRSFNDLDSRLPRQSFHPQKAVAASNMALK